MTRLLTVADPHVVNIEANGLVNPSNSIAPVHINTPSSIYGLRRPNRDFELSARTPASPCSELNHFYLEVELTDEWLYHKSRYWTRQEDHRNG